MLFCESEQIKKIKYDKFLRDIDARETAIENADVIVLSKNGRPREVVHGDSLLKYTLVKNVTLDRTIQILEVDIGDRVRSSVKNLVEDYHTDSKYRELINETMKDKYSRRDLRRTREAHARAKERNGH